jgi:hypothetical protein
VNLLGDIRKVEIGAESSYQSRRRRNVEAVEEVGGGVAVLPTARAHLLDELEHLGSFLTRKGVAEHADDPAYVSSKRGVID